MLTPRWSTGRMCWWTIGGAFSTGSSSFSFFGAAAGFRTSVVTVDAVSSVLFGEELLAVSVALPCCARTGARPSNAEDVRAISTRVVFMER